MSKLKAIVQFDYDAEAADELTLRVGDVLKDIKQIEEGWCQGVLNGKTGMFPDNFVKVEEDKTSTPKAIPAPTKSSKKAEAKRFVKVVYEYEPANSDELKLVVGDIVEILKEEEEGWALGTTKGKKGVFPTNFCVPVSVDSVPNAANENKEAASKPESSQPQSKKAQGVGFGDIFGGGPIKLKGKPVGSDPAADKPGKTIETAKDRAERPSQKPSKKNKTPALEKCRATFDYQATTDDELTIAEGDVITIITKDTGDDGWWQGEVMKDGKKHRGVFPDNFVVLISSDEVQKSPVAKDAPTEVPEDKPKAVESEKQSGKEASVTVSKNNSAKKSAPEVPAASAKPKLEDSSAAEIDLVVESVPSSDQLIHIRRVSGPKNRRKPDSAGRRERAKEAIEEAEAVAAVVDSEPEAPEPEPAPVITPKKEPNRGIQVMPSLAGGSEPGEKPAWMKNLKSRTSQKKDPIPTPANKADEPANEKPDWLSNLRKRPKTGEKLPSPAVPSKPAPAVTSPKPSPGQKQPTPSPASHINPTHNAAENVKERPTSFKRTQFKENGTTNAAFDGEATETKKFPVRPPAPVQTPGDPPKKPTATKPKPPPSKTKPALPGSKPVSSSSVDELKEEISSLRDILTGFQTESLKEIKRLSSELEEERKQRVNLQAM